MNTNNSGIQTLNVKQLLNETDCYVIPVYQRNYAWGAKEIEQLIQDIIDYSIHAADKKYYIGTLVVSGNNKEGKKYFYTIDGQQRLTTLTILSAVIKNKFPQIDMSWYSQVNLSFESRKQSTASLNAAFEGSFNREGYEFNIKLAYDICEKELEKKIQDNNISLQGFAHYLYEYVTILRVPLPAGTDLNHYFEIMNSRGEQLEKHEILKAQLMRCFNDLEERELYANCFNLIWEACSNMERYVQYGFTPDQRHLIFGPNHWNILDVYSFDQFVEKIGTTLEIGESSIGLSIEDILNQSPINFKLKEEEEASERFNTVIDFPNFLLHVLRVQIGKDEIALDDKRIIVLFDQRMPDDPLKKIEFVKEFIFNLLKGKFLFDKYIIKREFLGNNDKWSLKCLKWYNLGNAKNSARYVNTFGGGENSSPDDDNRRVLMLLSMFHVSFPSMTYKYWLNAAMNYLFEQFDVEAKDYVSYLEHIAKSFVFDRFLAKDQAAYYSMINNNLSPSRRDKDKLDLDKLCYKKIENNLVFNFCDYLLWHKYKSIEKNSRVATFEFTFRSSVEHYYPQTPFNSNIPVLDDHHLHAFGNLCLISHDKNSRLYNYAPLAKKEHYPPGSPLDSVKQYLMMKSPDWNAQKIEEHDKEMVDLLSENLNSTYSNKKETSLARKWFKEYQLRDKNLLVRALLCFADYPMNVSGNLYNLFDFEYILTHECFYKFEVFIEEEHPDSLQEIIDQQLAVVKLQEDYRYLFIKYPQVIDYCKSGYFQWKEDTDGHACVYLLEAERNTSKKAKELYTYLLQFYLEKKLSRSLWSDNSTLCIDIWHNEEHYELFGEGSSDLLLEIWNEDGKTIGYQISTKVNGNSAAVRLLEEYRWNKKEAKIYQRRDPKLITMTDNWEDNLSNLYVAVGSMFKNGLGIKKSGNFIW